MSLLQSERVGIKQTQLLLAIYNKDFFLRKGYIDVYMGLNYKMCLKL